MNPRGFLAAAAAAAAIMFATVLSLAIKRRHEHADACAWLGGWFTPHLDLYLKPSISQVQEAIPIHKAHNFTWRNLNLQSFVELN